MAPISVVKGVVEEASSVKEHFVNLHQSLYVCLGGGGKYSPLMVLMCVGKLLG